MRKPRNIVRYLLSLVLPTMTTAMILGLDSAASAHAQVTSPSWTFTGSLNTARYGIAILLPNGKVLVAGGTDTTSALDSAELYDPATGKWSFTGKLNTPRAGYSATLLPNGRVLIAGGWNYSRSDGYRAKTAELYDPATGTWSLTGSPLISRFSHSATLLANGKVLIAAGQETINDQGGFDTSNTAELYDPATGTWSITGKLKEARCFHTTTLLQDGKVLVAGGSVDIMDDAILDSAELYDPSTGTWGPTGKLNTTRSGHTATMLPNGKVLVAGGYGDFFCSGDVCTYPARSNAELYDPATGTWSVTGKLNMTRSFGHTATLLPNGQVLIAGGATAFRSSVFNSAEIYNPITGNWSSTADLNTARTGHTATLLTDGKVLAIGGVGNNGGNVPMPTTELYDAGANSFGNPIDDGQFFVQQQYRDFLNREPDAAGLAYWTGQINSCGGDLQCIEIKRINVSAAYFLSIEFQQTGYLVYRTYKASYGNLPDAPVPVSFNEFLPDTQLIGHGVVVNQTGWETVLENNKQAFVSNFVQRTRFAAAYPASLTPRQFVDTLFANAGVTPSATDRTAAINEFGSAMTTSDAVARARALRRVAENSILAQQEFNRAFVLMQYFGYLRRNPDDPPEPTRDFQGYNFWLNKLNAFNGDLASAEMVKAFITSAEYRQRFGP